MDRWVTIVKPVVEARYNVSADINDRAIPGDSAGGFWTCTMLAVYPNESQYYGIFAAGADNFGENCDYDKDAICDRTLFICSGLHDPATIETTYPTMQLFSELDIPFTKRMYHHMWHPWRQGLYHFLMDVL